MAAARAAGGRLAVGCEAAGGGAGAGVRIVAGRYGGRRIEAPRGRTTRPTADRVREALFSMLTAVLRSEDLEGLAVLDLFAGSGALGLEALSRGASAATFVDADAAALATVGRNAEALGVAVELARSDALAFLASASREGRHWDLIFVDPPYSSGQHIADSLAGRLASVVYERSLIVTESDKRHPLALPFTSVRERDYGDTRIVIRVSRES